MRKHQRFMIAILFLFSIGGCVGHSKAVEPTVTKALTKTYTPVPINTQTLTSTATITSTPLPASTITNTPFPSAGLGLSRYDVSIPYVVLGVEFEDTLLEDGTPCLIGEIGPRSGFGTIEFIGPEDDVVLIRQKMSLPQNEDETSAFVFYLASFLTSVDNDWEEGTDWINEQLALSEPPQNHEAYITQNGIQYTYACNHEEGMITLTAKKE